ncbi:MAG: hypothetical protein QOC92_584 [Acidimicrobiaceae bacterium]|jgi:uncharacterized cupredoxin-like copper-binding protein
MTRTRILLPVTLVTMVVGAALVGGHAVAGPGDPTNGVLGPGAVTVTLTIRHSQFSPDHLHVRPGTIVRFVVRNDDPINHELIIGDDGVHRRHETGTEAAHPPRPGEVSVAAGTTAETTFSFDGASVLYACHLPGHFAYGMSGLVDVVRT